MINLSKVVQPILRALADENEFVRETALKAGQRIVNLYAETAIQMLLPNLEQGLFDDNWRIRCLLGNNFFSIMALFDFDPNISPSLDLQV